MIKNSQKLGIFFSSSGPLGLRCKHALSPGAHKLFDRMPSRDVATWPKLMDGYYYQMGSCAEGLTACNEARNARVGLGRFGYAGALNVCARNGDSRNGRIIHGLVVVSGSAHLVFLTNSLIHMYLNCGKIDEVRLVFDYAVELDDVSWNLLLSAYVQIGWPEVAADILVWMHRNGVKLNSVALSSVLSAISTSEFVDPEEAAQRLLHGCVIKVGLDLDFFVGNTMHYIFAKNGGLDEAVKIFDCISNPSSVVSNAMIRGFSQLGTETCTGNQVIALRLYVEMLRRRTRPSKLTSKAVLEACMWKNEFKFAKQVHAHIIKYNFEEDEFIGSALIMVYSTSGLVEESLKCFESTRKQDIVTWESMIQGYIQNEYLERAMNLFRNFLRLGRKFGLNIISSLMVGSGNFGAVRSGEQIHSCAVKGGIDRFTVCCNSQMSFYSNIGDIDASVKIFRHTSTIDVVSWSLVILSHALHGWANDALVLFEKMKEFKISPTKATFLAVLTACIHGGLMDEGFRYLESMVTEYGLLPNVKHCACIVDLLGRDGLFAESEDFILTSGYNNDPVMWQALLRSCQFHGDTEWSIRVGEKLMELDPLASASYMLLYNLYSNMGKVSLAMRIRGRMRERGVNKEIGISWIEIGASVHSFVAGDSSHPQSSLIFAKLEEMMFKLKNMNNDNNQILRLEFQGEKWKDSLMNSHGEKLAVALGMICLPESVPIRVMKNTRMCGDCHTTFKLFSEGEKRNIILRDLTQFHHFSNGSCSCGDYW